MAGRALDIKEGGTSQTTAPGARIALGLEIGVDIQAHDADLDAISAITSTGIAVRTAADTWTTRTLTAPAAGFTITNPAGIAGNPTFVLANDLAALEALAGTNNIYYRSGVDTWSSVTMAANMSFSGGTLGWARTITGTANQITVSNGDGIGGNPTLALANPLTTPGDATINGTLVVNTNLNPDANDGAGLGTGALGWSDAFLAAGGVINWNNGALTATESAGSLTFNSTAAVPTYNFQGNDAGIFGPFLQLYHNSASPAASDIIGEIVFQGNSSTGVKRNYSALASAILDTTNASEDAQLQWYNMQAGTLTSQMTLDSGNGLSIPVGGIKFPSSAIAFADANTLDDYEEGTWAPVLTTTGVNFTSVTYTTQLGFYTKIGRLVIVNFTLVTSAVTVGAATGNIRISGLPFTCTASINPAMAVTFASGWNTNNPAGGIVVNSTTTLSPYYRTTANGSFTQNAVADVATGGGGNQIIGVAAYWE